MSCIQTRFATSSPIQLLVVLIASVPAITLGESIEKISESGPVKVTLTLDPAECLIGDPVTLQIAVVAERDVEVLMPEFGEALDRYAIIDFVPRESIDDAGRTISTQRYRLQPASSGRQMIPPILIEYVDRRDGEREAPEGLDAYEILTERIDFEVKSVAPETASAELRPPLGKLEPIVPPGPPVWPWVLGAAIIIAAVTPPILQAIARARRLARRKSAYEVARMRLEQLLREPRISQEEIDRFYVDLSNVVRHYLEDRFELRAPELTTEEFLKYLKDSPGMSTDHQALLRDFLRQADLVKFARAEPSESDMQASIDAAARFLEETRENAPLLDVEDDEVTHQVSAEQPVEASHG